MKLQPKTMLVVDGEPARQVFAEQGAGFRIEIADLIDRFDAVGERNAEREQQIFDLLNEQVR